MNTKEGKCGHHLCKWATKTFNKYGVKLCCKIGEGSRRSIAKEIISKEG